MDAELTRELSSVFGEALASQFAACGMGQDAAQVLRLLVTFFGARKAQRDHQQAEMERQAAEYKAEAARLQQQLEYVGVTPERLSVAGSAALGGLAAAASELGLTTASDASLAAAWTVLSLDDMRIALLQAKAGHQVASLQRALDRAQSAAPVMQQALAAASAQLDSTDAHVKDGLQAHMAMLQAKVARYKAQEHKLSDRLKNAAGWRPELSHHSLVKLSAANDQLDKQLKDTHRQLDSYKGLPPSQVGAELRVRQLREHLTSLQAQLQLGMANLD
ncbi:uncharacterized protein HaLaN_21582 [Haematococcus lacustris]|uniref:Uncharacterized protein n=1 Tax=Haematococcus lacustris TaxID=44745 RepID=A0A699ZRV8_HAELA|nr:hypothetical protein QJQ45_021653 [Haematococcus lacustris]GFH23890.1 uncharacterized protein HaLaN_21582 [Haematococcus lacustris]